MTAAIGRAIDARLIAGTAGEQPRGAVVEGVHVAEIERLRAGRPARRSR